jgi:hypothetical protein
MHILRDGFLYAGAMERVASHRHSAMLYLALSPEPFHVQAGDVHLRARAALIAPDQRKEIDGRGAPLACVDIAPTHRAFATFARGGEAVAAWSRSAFDDEDAALREFREQRLGPGEADALYGRLVARAAAQLPPTAPVDARVREVMRRLRASPAQDLRSLAAAVHL